MTEAFSQHLVRGPILATCQTLAQGVNSALTMLYREIGRRIHGDILLQKRAGYAEGIVAALRTQLGWNHFRQVIALDTSLKCDFYAQMCRLA